MLTKALAIGTIITGFNLSAGDTNQPIQIVIVEDNAKALVPHYSHFEQLPEEVIKIILEYAMVQAPHKAMRLYAVCKTWHQHVGDIDREKHIIIRPEILYSRKHVDFRGRLHSKFSFACCSFGTMVGIGAGVATGAVIGVATDSIGFGFLSAGIAAAIICTPTALISCWASGGC